MKEIQTSREVLGMRVDAVEADAASELIMSWAGAPDMPDAGRYVCAANVHMIMETHDDPAFRQVVNGADLVLPDGQPTVWALRRLGAAQERRVRVAPDLLLRLFHAAERRGVRLGLYGGTPESLAAFRTQLAAHYPSLDVTYAYAPPFRPLTQDEEAVVTQDIRDAGVQLLLVGIGCPKQERWMAAHPLPCVRFGVGAAFDMLSGVTRNAPRWMQDSGLEWVYRLASEPRRLWRRHLYNDPRFLLLFARQVLSGSHAP